MLETGEFYASAGPGPGFWGGGGARLPMMDAPLSSSLDQQLLIGSLPLVLSFSVPLNLLPKPRRHTHRFKWCPFRPANRAVSHCRDSLLFNPAHRGKLDEPQLITTWLYVFH